MARKKVEQELIADDIARKISYKKRKKSILKKMEELTTLCGIEACAIIYSDLDSQLPEIWPSDPSIVQNTLSKFNKYSQLDQRKKMLNQETYLIQRITKAKESLEKLRKSNREKEISLLLNQCLSNGNILDNYNLSLVDLNDLIWMIDQKRNEINFRLRALNENSSSSSHVQPNQGQEHGKEVLEMNMDASQDIPWYQNIINGGEGSENHQLDPFGGINYLLK